MGPILLIRGVRRNIGSWKGESHFESNELACNHMLVTCRLRKIHEILGNEVPLVLHGTTTGGDELVRETIRRGMRKVNHNRKVRERYMKFVEENSGKLELTELQTQGVQIYSEGIEREMRETLGSAGKA
jgi:fructose-bisphosphate aldolase class II